MVPLVAWRRKANNRKWSHIIIRHRCDIGREGRKGGRKAEQSCCIPAKALGNLRLVTIDSRKCRRCCILRWRERRKGGGRTGVGRSDSKLFFCVYVYSRFLPQEDCCHSVCGFQFRTSSEMSGVKEKFYKATTITLTYKLLLKTQSGNGQEPAR